MFSSNTSQASSDANYIEDVFSTYLYTGNSSTQTINNGIDLAGEGGLVWSKGRSSGLAGVNHWLSDTARGIGYSLASNSTAAQSGPYNYITLGASGYSLNTTAVGLNTSGETYASWTFRKQPKFFDVVTYTGNGTNNRQIPHSLASVPGCVIVKRLNAVTDWLVWHRSSGAGFNAATLNGTGTFGSSGFGPSTAFTDTYFTVANQAETNASGGTYVAYLFAHDAGGFGDDGLQNVVSCGSWTENGTVQDINLGYEPQFLLVKNASSASNWFMFDTMRGWPTSGTPCPKLSPNTTEVEIPLGGFVHPTATGFKAAPYDGSGQQQIYIAIRRGPMKTPTSGTSVFQANTYTTNGTDNRLITTNTVVDLNILKARVLDSIWGWADRLRGGDVQIQSNSTSAEGSGYGLGLDTNVGYKVGTANFNPGGSPFTVIGYGLTRAPGFFDEVCYTGTGSATTVAHNLGVAPELMIVKARQTVAGYNQDWLVYQKDRGYLKYLVLNISDAEQTGYSTNPWTATPSASSFSVGSWEAVNFSGYNYVAYLFASCPGVSKVGSYTGTGTTKQIDCGFTGGARFVLIKRTDSTGDWYVWDTARGIVSGNDPYLLLNSTAAEVTSTDYIDTYSAGFEISSTAPAAINASGGTFIFLAIA